MQISDRQRHACMDLRCEICMWEESREANFLCGECRNNERVREVNGELAANAVWASGHAR